MIDDVVFATEMAILADRFGRTQLLIETQARYFDALTEALTTEEFRSACRVIFEQDVYWPGPRRFIEAVKGDPAAAAESAWDELTALAARGDGRSVTPEQLATLRRIGVTFRDIELASDYKLGEIGKRFRAAHARVEEPQPLTLVNNQGEVELL